MKILLIEDEALVANLIERGLRGEGWSVDGVSSAEAAASVLREKRYDVLILDRTLPGQSGLEFCKELRSSGVFTPVLMLTALGDVADKIDGLSAGADDYLSKPFDFDELIARVTALGRRARLYVAEVPGQHYVVGNVNFDSDSLRVTVANEELDLTAKERELLVFFLKFPNKAFNREELLDNVWGTDADPYSNIVDVYIGKLRKKLGDADPQLDTVRGAGYRLSYQEGVKPP